ncbi:calcium-binding protein, partial [Anaeromusa acidaminophila]|uniref:calcium-binding protein n=1 Tax=Anaeromusa acidaminophila TaxID=81464 RepID=UPI000367270F
MAALTSFRGFSQHTIGFLMGVDFYTFTVSGERIVSSSSSEILIKYTQVVGEDAQERFQRFSGSFSYDANGQATGTITSIQTEDSGNQVVWNMSGLNVAVSKYLSYTAETLIPGILAGSKVSVTGGDDSDTLRSYATTNFLYGGASNDALYGGAGNDVLDGGVGEDSMYGGRGNDTYIVDNWLDYVQEGTNEGTDLVISTANSFSLYKNVENLTLQGAAVEGIGNELANVLTGNNGDNVLDGGAGADTMIGGAGNDTYKVDNLLDVVTEGLNAGTDTVVATLASGSTYTLGANVENLTLEGTGNVNGVGNALDNELIGNSGNNVLVGGLGKDILTGGAGDDTYIIDGQDTVFENPGEGRDCILYRGASGTLTIQNDGVETIIVEATGAVNVDASVTTVGIELTGGPGANLLIGGSGNDGLIGGAGDDELVGGGGNDLLDGGAGADKMAGGTGNDFYWIDRLGDTVNEAAGEGTDRVFLGSTITSGTFTLAANNEIEKLAIQGTGAVNVDASAATWNVGLVGGSGANKLTGGYGNDMLDGGAGNDVLDGGAGVDTMVGGSGDDTYFVDAVDDVVVEGVNGGTDLVQATVDFVLGENVENLILKGSASTGIGNGLANVLTGNSGDNVLDGGAGKDTMSGGAG